MADIENNNRAFEVDGIDIRSKQKPIREDSIHSRSIQVDAKSSAKIFLHDDGKLYFKDNEIKNPIPLQKVENIYERIKFEDGELRFYDKELKNYVNLSRLNRDKSSFQKNNSVIHSNTTVFDLDESFNANNILQESYSNFGPPISGSIYSDSDVTTAKNLFKNAFQSSTMDNFDDDSPINVLFDNYLTGIINPETEAISGAISGSVTLTLEQIQDLGYESFSEYINGKDFGTALEEDEFFWATDYILPDQNLFLGDDQVGFVEQEGDYLGKLYLAGRSISYIYDYLFPNLYRYNGVSKFLDSVFGIPGISEFALTPSIEGGLYKSTKFEEISSIILEEVARVISHTMINEFVKQFEEQLKTANLLVNNKIRPANEILGVPSVFNLAKSALNAMNNATFKATLMDNIDLAFNAEPTTLLAMNNLIEVDVGGIFGAFNFLPVDLVTMNEQWFDIPNLYKVSPVVSNENAITLSMHFPVNIKPRRNTRYEFRLIDSVSTQELDRVQIESANFKNVVGDVFAEKEETHPIQLSYFGPMPRFVCDEKGFQECFDSEDVLTHIKILADDCKSANPIGDASGFRNIANRFLADITTEVNEEESVKIDTPRIFKIQWRAVHLDEDYSKLAHYRALSNLTFSQLNYGEARMSMSIYNISPKKDSSLIKQGVVTFSDQDKKSVQFDFSLSTESDYSISLSCSKNIKVWYDTKTSHGFVIRAEKKFEGEVSWIFSKRITLEELQTDEKKLPLCFVDNTPAFGSKSNFDILREEGYDV